MTTPHESIKDVLQELKQHSFKSPVPYVIGHMNYSVDQKMVLLLKHELEDIGMTYHWSSN